MFHRESVLNLLLIFSHYCFDFSLSLSAVMIEALPIMPILEEAKTPNDSHGHELRIPIPALCLAVPHPKSRTWKMMKTPQQQRKATINNWKKLKINSENHCEEMSACWRLLELSAANADAFIITFTELYLTNHIFGIFIITTYKFQSIKRSQF